MFKFDFLARGRNFPGLNGNNPRKRQIFDFFWDIEVFNNSLGSVRGELFLPLPPELFSQKILQKPVFTPVADKIAVEEIYRNRYASWKVSLGSGEKKYFLCRFQAEISPVDFLPQNNFFLDDYAKDRLENKAWLSSNRFIQPQNPEIRKIAKETAGEEKDVLRIIKQINDYVVARLKYGRPIPGLYSADDALKKEAVDCGGFASLLVSLCLSLGIPARIVSGFWAGYSGNAMHVWVEMRLPDGSWISADPVLENLKKEGRTKKTGYLGFVGSDRVAFSYGCDLEIKTGEGKIRIDILQNPFISGADEKKITIKHNLKTAP